MLDLNGFTLEQSHKHALMQRFYALIETASGPFVPPQGPGNFGATLAACKGCVVKNGHLGLSSHHGIHGNRNVGLLLRDLTIKGYEVAGVSLNGAS